MANSDELFSDEIKQSEILVEALREVKNEMVKILAISGESIPLVPPKTLNDLEKLNKILAEIDSKYDNVTATTKKLAVAEATLKIKRAEANKEAKISAQLMNSQANSIERVKAELAQVTVQWNKTTDAQQRDVNVTGSLAQQKRILTNILVRLEEQTESHGRKVGSYTETIKTLGKGVGGAVGLFATLGRALGINTEAIEHLHIASTGLVQATKEFTHATHLAHLAHSEEAEGVKKLTIAQRILNAVRGAGAAGIGLLVAGVALLVGIGIELYNSYRKQTAAEEEQQKAIDGTIIKNEELRKKHNENIFELRRLGIEYAVLTGKMSAFDAAIQNLAIDYQVAVQSIKEETAKKLGEVESGWSKFWKVYKNLSTLGLTDVNKLTKSELEESIQINRDAYRQMEDEQKKFNAKKLNAEKEAENKIIEQLTKEANDIIALENKIAEQRALRATDGIKSEYEKNAARLAIQAQFQILEIQQSEDAEIIKAMKIKLIEEKLSEDLKQIQEQREKDKQQIIDDYWTLQMKKLGDQQKAELELLKQAQKEEEEARRKGRQQQIKDVEDLLALQKKHLEERQKLDEDYRKAKIDAEIKTIGEIDDAYFQGLDRKHDAQQKALSLELDQINNSIQQQTALANAGLDNTLAFQEKRKAEALAAQADLDERKRKAEQAKELSSVFLEFLKAYAKDGDVNAASKALAQTLIAKEFSNLIAGSAFEGTEDTGGEGDIDSRGGRLWIVHPHEGIVNRRGNESHPGLVGAMNDGRDAVRQWFDRHYVEADLGNGTVDAAISRSMVTMLSRKVDQLAEIMRNKKENHWSVNDKYEIVLKTRENGNSRQITYKRSPLGFKD